MRNMPGDSPIKVSYDGAIQIIEFDNPKKKNALTLAAFDTLLEGLDEAAKNDKIKMTVLTGRGEFYSSGSLFSIESSGKGSEPPSVEDSLNKVKETIDCLIDYPKILVAVVNGPAIGVACTTLALCDIVYASENAWFQTPFSSWGITSEGCSSYLFPRIMGTSMANRLLLFSEKMTAREALKCNFVAELYKPSEADLLWSRLRSYTSFPLGSWVGSKKLMRDELREKLHEINRQEIETLVERFNSDDFMEAMVKFMSRKKSKL